MFKNQFINLGFPEAEKKIYKKNEIEYNKLISKMIREATKDTKDEECLFCKKKYNSFCKSHSIPQFILKNIIENGELYNSNIMHELPFIKDTEGLKEAGVFHLICRECDSKVFEEYENPMNYEKEPTQKMLAQIAMKSYLNEIWKKKRVIEIHKKINCEFLPESELMDLMENLDNYEYAKNNCNKTSKSFHMFYYKKLDYVVPLAFQGKLSLFFDIEGCLINEVYNYSPKYEIKDLHLCIFPMKESSVIIMFIKEGEKRYRNFYKQFKKLEDTDKLLAITYMIFAYSEDIYMNKNLNNILKSNKELKEIAAQTSIGLVESDDKKELNKKLSKEYDFKNRFKLPNLLSEEYSIK